MKTASHLSSARVYSLVIIVAMYVDIDLVKSFSNRVDWLYEARKAFAGEYLKKNPGKDVPGVGEITVRYWNNAGKGPGDDIFGLNATKPGSSVEVRRKDGRRWRVFIPDEDGQAQNGTSQETESTAGSTPSGEHQNPQAETERKFHEKPSFIEVLRSIAAELDINQPDKKEYNLLLHDIEHQLVDKKISIPAIGLEFTPDGVPWIIALLTFGFLLLIRSQVRQVFLDADLAIEEPWIILDGRQGLERLLGGVWLLGICIAPWVTGSCLLAAFSGRIIAEGAVSTALRDVSASAAILSLVLLGGWVSLTATADLLRLRRLRQEKLTERDTKTLWITLGGLD